MVAVFAKPTIIASAVAKVIAVSVSIYMEHIQQIGISVHQPLLSGGRSRVVIGDGESNGVIEHVPFISCSYRTHELSKRSSPLLSSTRMFQDHDFHELLNGSSEA